MSMLRRGRFVHERRVSAGGAREFSAALGSNGRYVLAWARERVVEARYGKDVNLSGVKTVARVNTANGGPKLAAAADAIGDSAVAWEQGARDVSVVAAVRDHGGLHRPVVLSDLAEGPAAAGLQTAFRGRDALVVAWDGGDRQGPGVFAARFQGPTRATVSRVSPPDTAGSLFAELNSLATAVDNPVAVAWTQLTPPAAGGLSRRQVFASYWDGISPGFGPPEPLSAPGDDAHGATLAFGWPFPFPLFAVWTQSSPGSSASTVTVSGRG